MSDIKISVIMPVYNVEAYVAKAIESMLAQTLTDFEFLIVDDGTKDKSGIICDEYAKKDSRIHVIHKENGGAPSARNTAIDIAKGKYMYFMDSDDWAEPTMLEDMYALAEKNAAQLVVCGGKDRPPSCAWPVLEASKRRRRSVARARFPRGREPLLPRGA